jgi:hypothetical protein
VSTCSFKWHKATVLIAVLALCCFVFAGTALAGVKVTEPSHVLKADHTYDLTIEGSGFEVDLNTFCSDVPYGHPGFKGLIIDFPWEGTENYNFEPDNLTGADGKQIPVYLTIDGTEYMVPVVPVVEEDEAACDSASVADRVYLVIERQSLALAGNAKVTSFRVEGLEVLTPRTPSQNYNLCVSHTVTNCFAPMCTVLEVVPTVEYLELEIVEDSCLVSGSTISVRGQVYSTEYPADGACDEYAPWVGKNSWPVVICLMERITDYDCDDNPIYTYKPLVSTDNAVWTMDPCGKNQVCKDASSGEPIPCVATSIDRDGIFNATLELPAAGINGDIVVFARTIEAADNNEDSCLRYFVTVPAHQVAAESNEDIANVIEEVEGQDALRKHIVWGLYPPACENHAWVGSADVEVDIIAGAPFAIKGPVLNDQIEIANPMDPNCCQTECTSYPIKVTLIDKYCNVTINQDSCEGYKAHNIKVDLKAYFLENGKQRLAGIFYDADPCDVEANQIDHTFIPVGKSVADTVYFMPTHPGLINMQYSAIIDNKNKIWEQCGIEVNYNACLLEVTPLVTSDNCFPGHDWRNGGVSDGWPIKVSVHYDNDVPLRVEILNPSNYKPFKFGSGPDDFLVTWDTEAYAEDGILEFEAVGRYGHGDYFDHPFGNVPYDNNKSDFFVFPVNACGESFIIKVVDELNNIKDEVLIGPLASATEMVRILEPSKWQVLSTPKTLAGSGDLLSLFDGETPYNEALTYKNNQWQPVMPYDELEPLYAYVINTRQNWCQDACPGGEYCGENLPIYAKYVFDRVTDPSLTLLPERLLTAGANLIGPSFNESEIMLPFELEQKYLEFSPAEKKFMPCFIYEECCLQGGDCCSCDVPSLGSGKSCGPICPERIFQFDTLARMTATFCEGCSMIANYGGDSAGNCRNSRGNLAFFSTAALGGSNAQSWLTDPLHFAFNGDGYLAYVNGAQTYTGAAQRELVNITP